MTPFPFLADGSVGLPVVAPGCPGLRCSLAAQERAAHFVVRQQLKGNGQSNELIVCVGADPLALGDRVANGFDFEKHSYLAGIYDGVTLTLSGSPFVVNVQVVIACAQCHGHIIPVGQVGIHIRIVVAAGLVCL